MEKTINYLDNKLLVARSEGNDYGFIYSIDDQQNLTINDYVTTHSVTIPIQEAPFLITLLAERLRKKIEINETTK